MRRDLDDEQWQETKRKVHQIDCETCCCCKVLSPGEIFAFGKTRMMGGSTKQLDCAHRHPVSTHADEAYDVNNVFLLCREHHYRIDHFLNPVTGEFIEDEEHEKWWDRIARSRRM